MKLDFLKPKRVRPWRPAHWTYHGKMHVRPFVLKRDNYECQIKGDGCTGTATTVDHILPRSHGGSELPENLRAACRTCNEKRGNRGKAVGFFSSAETGRPRSPFSLSPRRNLLIAGDYSGKAGDGRR